ncbi:MAG TPA: YihY/virulence factor BrkB family protein [Blastocatellia bacterium]
MALEILKRARIAQKLAARALQEINDDNIFGAAAELAFWFLLALFPMLIFVTSLVGFLPGAQDAIADALTRAMPGQVTDLVNATFRDIVRHRSGGLISFGVLGTLWAASSGVSALIETLNVAYEVKETRSYWKVRLIAVGITLALAVFIVAGAAIVVFGDRVTARAFAILGLGDDFTRAWSVLDYLLRLLLSFVGIELIYYFAPAHKRPWRWVSPGAGFAVIAFILGTLGFSIYIRYAPSYSATYGGLGAVIVLMLWLYLVSLVVLIGGEINEEVEKASERARTALGLKDAHPGSAVETAN